jgi:YfiH family protein
VQISYYLKRKKYWATNIVVWENGNFMACLEFMQKINVGLTSFWQFESFLKEPAIRHFVSDRTSGNDNTEFTLSFSSSPDKELIRRNRGLVASSLGIAADQLYFPSQVHKTRIVKVTEQTSKNELMETDALITNARGLCIAVMSADCVPILLYDHVNGAVGAVHAGWRGTAAKILEKTLHAMSDNFGTKGAHLIAGIGPSVCQDSYEVGEEVVMEFTKAFTNAGELMAAQKNGKAKLDLWKANKLQLLQFGVADTQIQISDLCTVKNNAHFFSARKGDSGRFAAGIMLRE